MNVQNDRRSQRAERGIQLSLWTAWTLLVILLILLALSKSASPASPQGSPVNVLSGLFAGAPVPLAVDSAGVPVNEFVATDVSAQAGAQKHIGSIVAPQWTVESGEFVHITATTATVVKATEGHLLRLTINTPAAGTVSIFNLASASCTGTPSTNVMAVIATNATDHWLSFGTHMSNGICIQASAAMDLTAVYQ